MLSSYVAQAEGMVRAANLAPEPQTHILLYRAARTREHVLLEFDDGMLETALKRAYETVKSRHAARNSAIDGVLDVVDGSENAAFEAAIEEPGKESFGGVEQGRRGGREVEGPAWMLGEPLANLWMFVSGIV